METQVLMLKENLGIGDLMPLLIAMLLQSQWTQYKKAVASFLICVAAAFVTSLANDMVTWKSLMYGIPAVVVAASATYQSIWKNTNIVPWIQKVTDIANMLGKKRPVQIPSTSNATFPDKLEPK